MGNFQVSVVPKSDGCSQVKMITWIHHCPEDTHSWTTTILLEVVRDPKLHTGNCKRTRRTNAAHHANPMSGKNKCGFMWLYSYISLRSYSFKVGRQRTRGKVLFSTWSTTRIKIDTSPLNTLRVWVLAIISMWDLRCSSCNTGLYFWHHSASCMLYMIMADSRRTWNFQ